MSHDMLQPSDELIERALARRAPRGADPDLLRQIAAAALQTPQAHRWWPLGLPWMGEPARRVAWVAIVLMLMAAFALGAIVAGGLPRSPAVVLEPRPSGSDPSPSPEPSAGPGSLVAIEDVAENGFRPDVTYTSSRFEPRVTFRLRRAFNGGVYLVPSPDTSARTIVINNRGHQGEEIRLIRPYTVDCGTPDEHPDAATLAAAILAKPRMANVKDRGSNPYSASATPENLIFGSYPKRVIKIDGAGRTFDASVSDPDRCRLLMDPGSGDPTIEIRGDMAALLILTDIDGELVVIRVSDRGYDASTGAVFMTRDYLVDPAALTASPLPVYLADIFELETVGSAPAPIVSATPPVSPSADPSPTGDELRPSP